MVLVRQLYLKEPEKWKGTPEEKELVEYCKWWIKSNKKFYQKFSPVVVDLDTGAKSRNIGAKRVDSHFIIMSKRVLEVYNGRAKKNNK